MAGFTDLLIQSQPAYYAAGCVGSGTEGATWQWTFVGVQDNTGADVDLSAATGSCTILTAVGGTAVTTLTFSGGLATFTVSKTAAGTAGLASALARRECVWSLAITSGSNVWQVWGPTNSPFTILSND